MKSKLNTPEIMAPAGSFESLLAAIQAGANSVYFGVEQLNMRTRSSNNFTIADLPKVVALCKKHNVKAYITLNTILYDHDLNLMRSIVDAATENQINAVIASDHAVMNYCRKVQMPVHISTQANVSNIDTVEFYSAYADVIVLARELSLLQVAEINREIKRRNITGPSGALVKTELFVHGALCMAISGKCYLSLHAHYASANRGACLQNCRRSYIVTDKEEGVEFEVDNEYIMSAKDLCTINFLDKIVDAGVAVLKIEGRGRAPEYVFTTTQCYRQALASIAERTYSKEKIKEWTAALSTVYNRGFWDGYYLGKTMGEWSDSYGSRASEKKIFIGRGVHYFPKARAAEFELQSNSLCVGDNFIITGPETGIILGEVNELRIEHLVLQEVQKGDRFTMLIKTPIRAGDKLYKVVKSK